MNKTTESLITINNLIILTYTKYFAESKGKKNPPQKHLRLAKNVCFILVISAIFSSAVNKNS